MTTARATRMGRQPTLRPPTQRQGTAWRCAHASIAGTRHVQQSKPCEDVSGVRLLANGGIQLALADGVSGGARGDVAAQALVAHYLAFDGDLELGALHHWLYDDADAKVQAALRQYSPEPGAATGAAAWVSASGSAIVNRIGDCRVYALHRPSAQIARSTGLRLQCLLPDQTFASQGIVSASSVHADNPFHMVGNGASGVPEFVQTHIPVGAGLLLCSDGLHGVLTTEEMIAQIDLNDLPASCHALLHSAQQAGSTDDVSVVILYRSGGS